MQRDEQKKKCRGFTLVELMLVIAVMAILAGIIIGMSGHAGKKAAESKATAELQHLKRALDDYRLERGRYIGFPDDVDDILDMSDAKFLVLTNYVSDLSFEDPWANPYRYVVESRFSYRIWSKGPDGEDGSVEQRADDIR